MEELRAALQAIKEPCNQQWIVGRYGYKTPAQVRAEPRVAFEALGNSKPPEHLAINSPMISASEWH